MTNNDYCDDNGEWYCEDCNIHTTDEWCPNCRNYPMECAGGIWVTYSPGMTDSPQLKQLRDTSPDLKFVPR